MTPLLIGEANPYGSDPYFALYPEPEGSAGHRLCHLVLGFKRALTYLHAFERRNLCPQAWNLRLAREEAIRLYSTTPFQAVLLGRKVAAAFRLEDVPPFTIHRPWGDNFKNRWMVILPHPSGLCREWNTAAFLRARELVQSVYPYDLLY